MAPRSADPGREDPQGGPAGRLLAARAALVLVALVLLSVAAFAILVVQSRTVEESAEAIDIAGRQRMLTQRAALLAHQLAESGDELRRADFRRQLEHMADEMLAIRSRLLEDSSPEFRALRTAQTERIARQPPHELFARIDSFVVTLRGIAATPEPGPSVEAAEELVTVSVDGEILAACDALVHALRAETRRRVLRLRWAAALILALGVALLAAAWRLLLRPMRREFVRRLEELHASREMLHLTIEHSPLGIASCTTDGRISMVNPAWCARFDRSPDELVGRPLLELVEDSHREPLRRRLRDALRGDLARFSLPSRWRREGEGPIHAVLHCGVVLSALHRPRRLIVVLEDRTAEVRAREEAAADRERLSHLTRLATMGEMAAGIAHEINQPLAAVATYTQACRRLVGNGTPDPALLLETLTKVDAQARRAGEVIRRLRSFVRRRRSHSEAADLNGVVEEAIALVQTGHRSFDVPIAVELVPDLPDVAVDRVQIQQVVVNLARNAIEACGGDGSSVVVRTELVDDARVGVAIEDSGPGLDEAQRERIFEPFFTTKATGLGVGLSLSRSIVASHGGSLWWEPRPGGGSRFRFTLPTAVSASEGQRPPSRAAVVG